MSKLRLSGSRRKTRSSASKPGSITGEVFQFVGLALSGGKSDKACLAVLEYYPKHQKVFLSKLVEKIKNEAEISADAKINELLQGYSKIQTVAMDSPWNLPLCLQCKLKCPGAEACKEPQIHWMAEHTKEQQKQKKPKKIFTPYTQRAVEMYLSTELEEPFIVQHAMGANTAPLLARAAFLKKRLNAEVIEVYPKLSIWRLGRSLSVMKSHLRFHKHAVSGDESRKQILQALSHRSIAFVYDQDVKIMIENNHAFEAFICALTGFLKFKQMTEPRPKGFPRKEDWIEFPKADIEWDALVE